MNSIQKNQDFVIQFGRWIYMAYLLQGGFYLLPTLLLAWNAKQYALNFSVGNLCFEVNYRRVPKIEANGGAR